MPQVRQRRPTQIGQAENLIQFAVGHPALRVPRGAFFPCNRQDNWIGIMNQFRHRTGLLPMAQSLAFR